MSKKKKNLNKTKLKVEGKKFDENKAPLALIPPEAVEEEGRVWGMGAKKYGQHNFRSGICYTRILSALLRHTYAIIKGEDRDQESGLLHAAHVRCCAAMLIVFSGREDLDDRFKP
jgi:hypothetical protein